MYYKIRKDEKISDIVNGFDVPFEMIRRFNLFVQKEEDIYEGRYISLPLRYTILPGDTYSGISSRFGLTLQQLADINSDLDVVHSVVYPGQTIMLPPYARLSPVSQSPHFIPYAPVPVYRSYIPVIPSPWIYY